MLYALALGLIAGLVAGVLFETPLALLFFLLAVATAALLFSARARPTLLIVVLCAAATLGIIRAHTHSAQLAQTLATLTPFMDRMAVIEGSVSADPDVRSNTTNITINAETIDAHAVPATILVSLPRDESVSYGDNVRVRGALQTPQPFDSTGGRQFDYPHYLQTKGIVAVMPLAALSQHTPSNPSIFGALFSLRHSFEHSLQQALPEPQVALLEGIELGDKTALPKDINQAFIASGLVHMVVLSGYNLSIISETMLRALSFLPRTLSLGVGGVGMIFFAIMTGGGAATVRALIMGLIAILARYLGRPAAALRALTIAATAMALWNPLSVLYDPSFILSVLATLGLITLSPTIEARVALWLQKLRAPNTELISNLRSIAASTIAVQIFVLPALLYFTGNLSLVALPANLLALPLVPLTMLAGFITGIAGMFGHTVALLPALLTNLTLRYLIFVAQTAASIPLGVFIIPAFPAWLVAAAYLPLCLFAFRMHKKAPA